MTAPNIQCMIYEPGYIESYLLLYMSYFIFHTPESLFIANIDWHNGNYRGIGSSRELDAET
jgi:hypothetical protein